MSVSLLNNPSVVGSLYPAFGGVSTNDINASGRITTQQVLAGPLAPGNGFSPCDIYVNNPNTGFGATAITLNNALDVGQTLRWETVLNSPETGGNAGSDYALASHDDTGALITKPLIVRRATGATYNIPAYGAKYLGIAQPFQNGGGVIGNGGTWQIPRIDDLAAPGSYEFVDIVSGATGTYVNGTYTVLINGDYIKGFATFVVAGGIITSVPASAITIDRNDWTVYKCAVAPQTVGPLTNQALTYTQGPGVTAAGLKTYMTTIMRVA